MHFHYSEYPGIDGQSVFRPAVPITLRYGMKNIHVEALIDSGADYTLIPLEIASVFDFKLSDQPHYLFYGAGSNTFTVYRSPVEMDHILSKSGFQHKLWKSFVYFAESQPTILLGQRGFLDRFDVHLKGKEREVVIL